MTIATTRDAAGEPVGVTASSFNSVSINPPLVLWSLSKQSLSLPAFTQSGHFAIHVLAAEQRALSDRFARSQSDKWDGLAWHVGTLGSPLLDDHAAVFECKTAHEYDGGDHIILVGEVIAFETRDKAPLLFHGGRYSESRSHPGSNGPDADSLIALIEHAGFIAHYAKDPAALEAELAGQFTAAQIGDAAAVLKHVVAKITERTGR